MIRIFFQLLQTFVMISPAGFAMADDSRELRKQRLDAQRERQRQVTDRTRELNDSTRAFREYARDLDKDFRDRTRELDVEFKLQRVELKADHNARVAGAEAEYQKNLSDLLANPGAEFTDQTIQQMQAEAKTLADTLFDLRKQSADELHAAVIANEDKKNVLLARKDKIALKEAASLGLTGSYTPVLATPIGEGLTKQEERWNELQKKEAVKIEQQNRKALTEYRNGSKLREWEVGNLNEDFKLAWDQKAEIHALESKRSFYNTLLVQGALGKKVDRSRLITEMAELNHKQRLVNIEYRKMRDKIRITRGQERRKILAN